MKKRLTHTEIERLKIAGQAKREERRKRRKSNAPQTELCVLPKDLEKRLQNLEGSLERFFPFQSFSEEQRVEAESLLLPEGDPFLRMSAYLRYTYLYERIIFFMWQDPYMSEKAFIFFDEVLSDEKAKFSANSLLNLIAGRVDENLLKIFQNHQQKFQNSHLASIIKTFLLRYLKQEGSYDCHKTGDEIKILQGIYQIFSSDRIKTY